MFAAVEKNQMSFGTIQIPSVHDMAGIPYPDKNMLIDPFAGLVLITAFGFMDSEEVWVLELLVTPDR